LGLQHMFNIKRRMRREGHVAVTSYYVVIP